MNIIDEMMENYVQCNIEDLRGFNTGKIESLIFSINPDENEAKEMAEATVKFLKKYQNHNLSNEEVNK